MSKLIRLANWSTSVVLSPEPLKSNPCCKVTKLNFFQDLSKDLRRNRQNIQSAHGEFEFEFYAFLLFQLLPKLVTNVVLILILNSQFILFFLFQLLPILVTNAVLKPTKQLPQPISCLC